MIRKRRVGAGGSKSVHFNARLPRTTAELLHRYAERQRLTASAAAVQLLEEALRMEQFPGIDFRWTPSGRHAHVTGTGLAAWELYMIWRDHSENLKRVRDNYPHLSPVQIQGAVAYMKAYPDEMPDLSPPPGIPRVRV